MSFVAAILGLVYEVLSYVLLIVLGSRVNSVDHDPLVPPRRAADGPSRREGTEPASVALERSREAGVERLGPRVDTLSGNGTAKVEAEMSESFLSQLEQRTEQVKITLANLEAEKVRIEAQIAQLQPVIPHYDALLAAERALTEANVSIEASHPAQQPAQGWNTEPQQPADSW